jgi:hypothetical protein
MQNALKIALVSAAALATAAPAFAQYQPAPQYQPTQQYQRDLRTYETQQAQYERSRSGYEAARRDYERRRADWQRARADYDARYGYGAYIRAYGPEPVWDDAYWAPYAPSAGGYGANAAYTNVECRPSNNSTVAGGLIGALAGAALGSNVAARNARTEGAVLGAVVGGAIGAGVGRANDRYKCVNRGPYYSYNDTIAYRESAYDRGRRSGRYDYSYYNRQRCRLAAAPVDSYGEDYRYVRVCPDRDGRYRITG